MPLIMRGREIRPSRNKDVVPPICKFTVPISGVPVEPPLPDSTPFIKNLVAPSDSLVTVNCCHLCKLNFRLKIDLSDLPG